MKIKLLILLTSSSLFFTFGCTKDQVYRGVYEGLTIHEELETTRNDRLNNRKSYDQYKQERAETLQKD